MPTNSRNFDTKNPRPLLWLKIRKLTLLGKNTQGIPMCCCQGVRCTLNDRHGKPMGVRPPRTWAQLVNLAREFCQNNPTYMWQSVDYPNPHCFHFLAENLCHFAMVSVCNSSPSSRAMYWRTVEKMEWFSKNQPKKRRRIGWTWMGCMGFFCGKKTCTPWKIQHGTPSLVRSFSCSIVQFLGSTWIFQGCTLRHLFFFWAPAAGGGQIGASEMHWLIWSRRKNSLSFWNSSIIGNRLVTSSSEVKNLEPQAVHCKCHSILEMTLSVWKMKILPLRLGTFLTCHLSKATSFSLVLFSLRNLAAMNKKSTTSNCAGSHYFPITQWVPSIRRLCYTVDGSEIRLTNWGW